MKTQNYHVSGEHQKKILLTPIYIYDINLANIELVKKFSYEECEKVHVYEIIVIIIFVVQIYRVS